MINFKKWLLSEQQQIQLSLSAIKNYLQKGDYKGLSAYTYQSLRMNRSDHEQIMQSYGNNREALFKNYEALVASNPNSRGSWVEWYPNGQKLSERVPKLYFTPGTSKKDMIGFLNGFRALYDTIGQVAKKYNVAIGFKIPTDLWKYLEENDRLVVHLGLVQDQNQQQTLAKETQQAIRQWADQNGVTLHQRTYDQGEDIGQRSFGVRVADSFVNELQKMLTSHLKLQPDQPVPQQQLDSVAMWYIKMIQGMAFKNDHVL